jgi:hypothetical protein
MDSERFATPEDLIRAHKVVEEELGEGSDLNFYELPKNKGTTGDGAFYGHSVLVRIAGKDALRHLLTEGHNGGVREGCPTLEKVSSRICQETGSVCRVFVELTPIAN